MVRNGHWYDKRRRTWRQRYSCRACASFPSHARRIVKPGTEGQGTEPPTGEECAIVTESLERSSMRILARRFRKDKTTVMRIIHRVTARLPDSMTVARTLKPRWSGILVFDGKYVRVYDRWSAVMTPGARVPPSAAHPGEGTGDTERPMPRHWAAWICGIDHGTGDLPHYQIAEEETKIDLVLYFQRLREIGYPMKALVSDGNPDIVSAARKVCGDAFVHQRCTKHFIDGLMRLMRQEERPERCADTLKLIRLLQCIIRAPDLEAAGRRLAVLPHVPPKTPVQRRIMEMFHEHKEALTAHLLFPELHIPSTSNEIENLFRQANLRLRSLGQFRHWKNAENYLKAWALWRRFTPFTDCRGARKGRNGQAPLTLADVDLTHVDMYDFPGKCPP